MVNNLSITSHCNVGEFLNCEYHLFSTDTVHIISVCLIARRPMPTSKALTRKKASSQGLTAANLVNTPGRSVDRVFHKSSNRQPHLLILPSVLGWMGDWTPSVLLRLTKAYRLTTKTIVNRKDRRKMVRKMRKSILALRCPTKHWELLGVLIETLISVPQ